MSIVKDYFFLFRPHVVQTAVCDSTLHIEHYYITRFVTIIMFHVMLLLQYFVLSEQLAQLTVKLSFLMPKASIIQIT